MVKYIIAVSGGVDSVVLLDMLSRGSDKLIVAHVDHGIRNDSAADARFVAALARQYQLPFVSTALLLGPHASEELARDKRYAFLFSQATEHGAVVVTAHHLDDVVETVALNIERGTGWRGLAVMGRNDIQRPLIRLAKAQIYTYALNHHLEWVEDSTNATNDYLRNRLRHKIAAAISSEVRQAVMNLRTDQLALRRDIARESSRVITKHKGSRHFMTQITEREAIELLGYEIEQFCGTRPLRQQLRRALVAIKTARPGTKHHLGGGVELNFTARKYHLSVL